MDELTSVDVARFRLLANSISKPGNQDIEMGAHDLNLLFYARTQGLQLGKTELAVLSRLGLKYLTNENVPFWCWYTDLEKRNPNFDIALSSLFAARSDEETLGAITVFRALGWRIPTSMSEPSRESIIKRWVSDHSSTRLRSAALGYLSMYGTEADYAYARKCT